MSSGAPDSSGKEVEAGVVLERVVVAGLIVAVVSFGVTMAVGILEGTIAPYDRLDPDSESSVFNWASSGTELIAAFVCAVHAVAFARSRATFSVLTGLLLFFAFDDAFVVHESIGTGIEDHLAPAAGLGVQVWTAAYAPLLTLVAILLLRAIRAAPRDARRLLVAGLALFVAAIAAELLGATSIGEPLPVVVGEEALELSGWELVATALMVVLSFSLISRVRVSETLGDARRA